MSQSIDLGGNDLVINSLYVNASGPGQVGTLLESGGAITTGTTTVTSASANSLAVGPNGSTTPLFNVDSSTSSAVAGLKITGAATGGTVAVVTTDSGSNTNLTINAKGSGTIGIGSVSTGAVTITPATTVTGALTLTAGATVGTTLGVTGVTTPTGGVAAAGGFAVSPRCCHTGNTSAQVSTDFTDQTPVTTEVYFAEVFVPANTTITGVSIFRGSVSSGNYKVGLANSSGVVVATSASTASSGTDSYVDVAFTAPYAAVGPATYYVLAFYDNNTVRANTHTLGRFVAGKQTGQTYATGFTTITSGTSFTTALGPVATLY